MAPGPTVSASHGPFLNEKLWNQGLTICFNKPFLAILIPVRVGEPLPLSVYFLQGVQTTAEVKTDQERTRSGMWLQKSKIGKPLRSRDSASSRYNLS